MLEHPPDEADDDMDLEAGLRAAFGPQTEEGEAVPEDFLVRLFAACGGARIDLPEEDGGSAQVLSPIEALTQRPAAGPGRYEIAGEIARGGVGVVLLGRDRALGRQVALKMLRAEFARHPAMARRLVEEAQICGQLQHPGILPVYELGVDEAGRPYFAMKLICGRTLAALLAERPDPLGEVRPFVGIYEQVCRAVAYAHGRGVVHRDLKPANVLVGRFGEAQVVDWGLAKVVAGRPGAGSEGPADGEVEAIATIRTGDAAAESGAGSVLGTPAYMPPEQARGEVAAIDPRADVFALGAILCEILTGRPPYGGDRDEVLCRARAGDLDEAFARLRACAADEGLAALAVRCLAADREARPRDASEVVQALADWSDSEAHRARAAEREAEAARYRAAAERQARRITTASATVVVLALLLGGGAALRAERHRRLASEREEQRRRAELEDALGLFTSLRQKSRWMVDQAAAAPGSAAASWARTLFLCRTALESSARLGADEETRLRRRELLTELADAERAARRRADEFQAAEKLRAKTGGPANP